MPVFIRLLGGLLTTFVGQIFAALGLSVVSYGGAKLLQNQFVNYISGSLNSIPPEILQIFYLAGGGVALNWIFGATSFALSLSAVSKLGSIFKAK
nr:DUF2523 domain-containing protein [uncultured Kingella sp.]